MLRNLKTIFILSALCVACNKGTHPLPNDLDKKLVGSWVVRPANQSSTFLIHRLKDHHDHCNVLRFDEDELYWYYLERADTLPHLGAVNNVKADERSKWDVDDYTGTISLHKIESSVDGLRQKKTRYFLYQFSPDTFTLQMDKHLIYE